MMAWLARAMWALAWGLLVCCLPARAVGLGAIPGNAGTEDFGFIEPYFENVGDSEAIPFGIVTALLQDAKGWLWIGTQKGLLRYDGYRFHRFLHVQADPASLPGDFITALWQGLDGRLWVGTRNDGVARLDQASGKFSRVPGQTGSALTSGAVWALAGDAAGGVWIGTDVGLHYAGPGDARVQRWNYDPAQAQGLRDNRVYSLLLAPNGTLWLGTANGLQRRKAGSQVFEWVASDPADPSSLAGQEIRALFRAQDGKLWLGTVQQGAAWLAEPDAINPAPLNRLWYGAGQRSALANGQIKQIMQPLPGQIWIATYGGGITVVSPQDGSVLRQLRHDSANPNSLAYDTIGALLQDTAGTLWVGTWGAGIQRHQIGNRAFRLLGYSPLRPAGLSHGSVQSVLELADGRMLVGSSVNGIDIIDRRRGLVGGYRPAPGHAGALQDGFIQALAQTPDGTIWAGTHHRGVFRLLPGSSGWQAYTATDGLPHESIRRFAVTRDGVLWVGTQGGLARWQAQQQRFVPLVQADGFTFRATVSALAEDRQGRLWCGSDLGLWVLEPGARGLVPIQFQADRPDGLSANEVPGLLLGVDGELWVATRKGVSRLRKWDGKQAVFDHASAHAAKSDQYISSNLLQDKQGRIWTGGYVFEPQTGRLHKLSKADGYDLDPNWGGTYARTHDGLFLYGGPRGLAVVAPEQFQPWRWQPLVQATELKIDGKTVALGALMPALVLTPKQHNVSIEFAALDLSNPKHNRYAWRLQGFESGWVEGDAEHRVASYGNLPPGRYTLMVRGSNRTGEWSANQLALQIQVLPAYWQTLWFRGLALLLVGASGYAAYRWHLAQLHARAQKLRTMVRERTQEILAAHSDLASAHDELERSHQDLARAHQDLQSTQKQLILQEKMAGLGTLTAGVAHEINNPTNFTHVAAQNTRVELAEFEQYLMNLLEDEPDPAMVDEFKARFASLQGNVNIMLNGTERIKTIVRDLRAFTRLDEAEKKAVHLSECLLATMHLVRTRWLEQVEFITEFTDDPPYECWPALLNQVFMNLMVNGCQAVAERQRASLLHAGADGQCSVERGKLWLRLYRHGMQLRVEVEDDGVGMSPDVQTRILEPFFTTKEVGSGTGLGLSISYGIIQKHNGTLDIRSRPGQGSCFVVQLPLTGGGDS
jgi:signal transduction histidine kinase/ligand-binding sensor domain-containing protein